MSNHISKIELSFLYIFFFLYPFYIELLEAIVVKVYQAAEIEYVGLIKKKISMQRIISLTFLFTMDLSFFFTCIIGYQENTKRNENKIYFWVNRRIVSFFFFFTFLDLYFPRYYPMKSYVAAKSNNKKFVLSDPLCSWIKFNRMFQIEIGKRCHRIWRSNVR